MTIHRNICLISAPSFYNIVITNKDGSTIFSGSVGYLLKNRKDLLNLEVDGEITYKVGKGYYCKVL